MAFSILPDAGLRVTLHPPPALLSAHVETYWSLLVERPPAVVRVVPDGMVDVVFDLRARAVYVNGPRDQPATFTHQRPAELLGVSLRPGTSLALLGVSAASLSLEWRPLSDAIGPVADELARLVFAADGLPARLSILDGFLLARIFATAAEPRVRQAVAEIVDSDGAVDVEALGRAAGASPRNLGRLFDDWVGMPPKRFARSVRLQAVMRRLADAPDLELATLAQEAGYADQAHLTREMRALAGISPRDLALTLSDSFKK